MKKKDRRKERKQRGRKENRTEEKNQRVPRRTEPKKRNTKSQERLFDEKNSECHKNTFDNAGAQMARSLGDAQQFAR